MTPPPIPATTDPLELQRYAADLARVLNEMRAEIMALQRRLTVAGIA